MKLTWRGLMQAVVLASCALIAFANVVVVSSDWAFDDMQAYLAAAERLRSGESLYSTDVAKSQLYRYSPWFAAAWIPLTFVPTLAVELIWFVVLAISFSAALWPFRRSVAGICLAMLLGALLYRTLGWGNVQPLVVAALVWSIPTRAGPVVLGVVGSLKPLALVAGAVYLWRGEWRSAALAVALAGLLWAPALLLDLSDYPPLRVINLYDATLLLAAVPLLRRPSGT